ncbi:MAG: hypothetical protein ACLFR2_13110 [Candidatus Kapaibacterium sp.]
MILVEEALKLIFLNSDFVDAYSSSLDEAIADFEDALDFTTGISQLKEVLKLDRLHFLPISLAIDTYEKYLALNRNDTEILRNYADFINDLIPEWGDYADKLTKEADEIEKRDI